MAKPEPIPCDSPDCGKPIVFALVSSQRGKPSRMPLDAEPNPKGNVACFTDGRGVLVGRILVKDQKPAGYEHVMMPHFATCTRPQEHRRRKPGKWTTGQQPRGDGRKRRPAPNPPSSPPSSPERQP